jgi:transcriptional regulator with XRE-family HTH domain
MSGEVTILFINKSTEGLNNICGTKIAHLRKELNISQRELADRLQLEGLDIDKNAIQRIECGKRFVTDIELKGFAEIFGVSLDSLI